MKNFIEYSLIVIFSGTIKRLPWRLVQLSGTFIGNLFFYLIPIRKKVVVSNLENTFQDRSDPEIKSIARKCYINFGKIIFEFIKLSAMNKAELFQHVEFENPELLKKAYEKGNGTLCISGHFGNWELMAAAISQLGYPMRAIAKEQRNKRVDRVIQDIRLNANVHTILLGMALRGVLGALKKNEFVAMLTDQDAHREGVFVDFLNRPSATAPGPAQFSLKNKAPLLFGAAVRDSKGNHRVHLEFVKTEDLDGATPENIRLLTQRHTKILEKYVKRYPDHWFWMHKRWKTAPPPDYTPLETW